VRRPSATPDRSPCPYDTAYVVASIGGTRQLDAVGGVPWDQFPNDRFDVDQLLRERFRPEGLDGIKATVFLGVCGDCNRLVAAVRMADHRRLTAEHGPAWTSPWTPLYGEGERRPLPVLAGAGEQAQGDVAGGGEG
jgi:hypothetical protein